MLLPLLSSWESVGRLEMTELQKRHFRGVVTSEACAVPKEIAGSGCLTVSAQGWLGSLQLGSLMR